MLSKELVVRMLERLENAVTVGDLKGVSGCYAFPGLFLVGEDSAVFDTPADFEEVFAEGRKWYVEKGITEARAELERFDLLTDTIASIDVRWPGFDENGVEVHTETSNYVVQFVSGEPLIRVALTRTLSRSL